MDINQLKQLLGSYSAAAKKSFSQNFLYSDEILEKIVSFVPKKSGFYIEIGGGVGTLTEKAIERGLLPLTTIDVDDAMLKILQNRFGNTVNVKKEDGVKLRFETYFQEKRGSVFGNLPYSVSSPILFSTCQQSKFINSAVYLLQKEVAEKVISMPGSREFSPIGALVNLVGSAELLFNIPPEAFFPAPKVWSSLVKIKFDEHNFSENYLEKFASLMKKIFSNRRKTLLNVFKINGISISILEEFGIKETARIEEISWSDLKNIADKIIEK